MQVRISAETPLLRADGLLAPARTLIGETSLITFQDGKYIPVPAIIEPAGRGAITYYQSGRVRRLWSCDPLEFMSESGYADSLKFHNHKKQRAGRKVLAHNKIVSPRTIPVFGNIHLPLNNLDAFVGSIVREGKVMYDFPSVITMFDEATLFEFLRQFIRRAYPDFKIMAGSGLKSYYKITFPRINKNYITNFVHLMSRFGVVLRKQFHTVLVMDDEISKRIVAQIAGLWKSKGGVSSDITMTDYIWVIEEQGQADTVLVTVDAENICDGFLIWRKRR